MNDPQIIVEHISYRRRLHVNLSEIDTTEPMPGVTAYWYGDERIVLTPEQKAAYWAYVEGRSQGQLRNE